MLSLRVKFTLALFAASLATLSMVGAVAYARLYAPFNEKAKAQSFARFCENVEAYIEKHGGWEREGQESFPEFQQRQDEQRGPGEDNRLSRGGGSPGFAAALSQGAKGAAPGEGGWRPAPQGRGFQGFYGRGVAPGSLPPGGGRRGGPDGAGERGPGRGGEDGRPAHPPRRGNGEGGAPFHFMLMDQNGRVLGGDGPYQRGFIAPQEVQRKSTPILVNGKLAARAYPVTEPVLTAGDQAYLDAVKTALLNGALLSLAVTVILGVFLGNHLSSGLRRLTDAARAMAAGQLRQRVDVRSSDEVGELAQAFNRMSHELSRAHEELKQSEERVRLQADQLREQSIRDALTGLHNRRFLTEQAEHAFAESRRANGPLCVALADVDHFKRINDSFSHAVGDRVLQELAELLRTHIRAADVVARYGGEEFVLMLPHTGLEQAEAGCEALRRLVESYPWRRIHPDLQVTMSFGVTDRQGVQSVEQMLARADAYLYAAKHGGRNRVASSRRGDLAGGLLTREPAAR